MSPVVPEFDQSHLLGIVEQVVAEGVRRPGDAAGERVATMIHDRFTELGLERVRLEPIHCISWQEHDASVEADGGVAPECFAVPLCEPGEVRGELARWDANAPDAVAGKVAVVDLHFLDLPPEFPVLRRRAALKGELEGEPVPGTPAASGWAYDPDDTFASTTHLLPFSIAMQHTMDPAIEAGAIGFVGVLHGYPGDCRYYVPYDGLPRSIPGVYVNATQAGSIDAAAGRAATVTIRVDATRGTTTTHNVVGELPGADDEWVVIGTHHDAPWASAVEDGTGIALVLAQAEAWSRVPAADRPHRLVFLAAGAHMVAGAGTSGFVEAHAADMDRIVVEVHLEHAALDTDADGAPLDQVTPRWWFTTEVPWLEQVVWDAIVTEGLDRSLMLTPDALDHRPTTDGGFFHEVGVPLVNYLAAPWYLFDPADTLDKVDVTTLGSLSRAAWRIVAATRGLSAAEARVTSG